MSGSLVPLKRYGSEEVCSVCLLTELDTDYFPQDMAGAILVCLDHRNGRPS